MATYEEIKSFWIESGKNELDADGLKPTARDPYLQLLNEHYISDRLDSGDFTLDIGCGEGTSSIRFASGLKKLVGVDYSETLIMQASRKKLPNTEFIQGDALDLSNAFPKETFDSVVSIRCLINLPEEAQQYQALESIFQVLKPGGRLYLSEGYQAGWDGLNIHRQRNNLDVMHVVSYNRLFQNLALEKFLQAKGSIVEFIGFGEYLYGSRIVHPLLERAMVRHESNINKVFAELQMTNTSSRNYIECDYAGIYVVRKK